MILRLEHFNAFHGRQPVIADALLNTFANEARKGALIGHRMLCLVQSDDTRISLSPVGGTPVAWNPAESLNTDRKLPLAP